jgi:hypothetical protein
MSDVRFGLRPVWCPGTRFGQIELVVDNDADLLAVLRKFDSRRGHDTQGPNWLEWPRSYDCEAAAERFARLTARLEADFAVSMTCEQDVQDSSEYGRVLVPAEATGRGTRIVVCVSTFGSLAVICVENPGAFLGTSDALAEGALDSADLAKVHQALTDLDSGERRFRRVGEAAKLRRRSPHLTPTLSRCRPGRQLRARLSSPHRKAALSPNPGATGPAVATSPCPS